MPLRPERMTVWRLRGEPENGDEVEVNGRTFKVADVTEYTTAYGDVAPLVTFDATCDACGCRFQFESGIGRFKFFATCPGHRGQARRKRPAEMS